jgi:hypothetical protein
MIAGSRRIFSYFTAAVLALGAPRALAAQDSTAFTNHLYDKWQINVDFTTVLNNSTARFDASDGERGTDLDFRSMLGISGSSIQPALGLSWKPGRRTEFDLGYQFINQSGSRTLTDTLHIGNDSVAGGLHADTKVGASNLTFQFKYALFAGPGHTIGLALGLGRVYLSLELDAEVAGCSGTACADGAVTVSKEFIGPTASLGAYGRWRVGDRWYVGGMHGRSGRISTASISASSRPTPARSIFCPTGLVSGRAFTTLMSRSMRRRKRSSVWTI